VEVPPKARRGRVKLRQHAASLFAVALAVACVVAVVLDQGKITDVERQDRLHDVFPAYRRGDIDAIELVQGPTTIKLVRRPDPGDAGETHWQMISPADERADPAAVDRFIGDLEFAGAIRKVDASASPEVAAGFAVPRVRGTLSMKTLVYHFALGGPSPAPEGAAYLRVDGEGTFVVSKDFVTSVMNGPDSYRERNVVPYLSLDLESLEVKTPDGGFTVTRADDVAFKLSGDGFRASRDGMDKIWGALAEARAESFLTDKDADGAIGASPIRVSMTPKDASKPKGELLLGGACPGHAEDAVLVRVSPTRESACVPKGALDGLKTPASALVDHRLFITRSDEVEEIVFDSVPAGFTLELARKGRGWHERKPLDRELEGAEVDMANDLVTKLTRGDALSVEPEGNAPFAARARVRVKRASSTADEVVELGATNEIVRRVFDTALLHVPSVLGRRLLPSEISLRARPVFPDGLGAAKPSTLTAQCDGVRQSLTRTGDAWTMREPHGFTADPLATADLVGLVKNAQAESWVVDRDDGTFGLAESTCQVEITADGDGGKRTLGIVFGKEAEGGTFYARATSSPAVFLAPRALREGATNWLIDRGAFRADPREVVQVTLSRGTTHTVLLGRKGAARDAGASDVASKVLDALEVMRPDAVVHLGPPKADEGFGSPTLDVRVKTVTDAGTREIHFVFGDTARVNRERLVYARVDGVDATYGIARDRVGPLVDAL
jgi:hypothetical protein